MRTRIAAVPKRTLVSLGVIAAIVIGVGVVKTVVVAGSGNETFRAETTYGSFTKDVYEQVNEHYWQDIGDTQLSNYYAKAISKITGRQTAPATTTKAATVTMFEEALDRIDSGKQAAFTERVNAMVVNSLQPQRRNTLFTKQKEKELRNEVANVNPDKDLYEQLGLEKGAATSTVKETYQEKKQELAAKKEQLAKQIEHATSSDRKKQLAQQKKQVEKRAQKVTHAKNVLSDEGDKERYDERGSEPTVHTKRLTDRIFYMDVDKVAPTTLQEFVEAANSTKDETQLDTLVLDLRGNMGGAIDVLPHFLGPFIGNDHVAYRLFRRGDHKPTKTKTGWLNSMVKFKRMVVLVDGKTKSSGEVMAATLKKFNVGTVVGTTTKGWGSVENTYPVATEIKDNTKHTLLLVNHLTVRPNGQPIEGNGVVPDVKTGKNNWQEKLRRYHRDENLIREVEVLINSSS